MTFSIAAGCANSGQFGVAVTSSSICVASRCAFVKAGVGAALSQNITDPELGALLLEHSNQGSSAAQCIEAVAANRDHVEYRQLAIVDQKLRPAFFTGQHALGITGGVCGKACVAVGNLLDNAEVPAAMVSAFESADEADNELAVRLLAALKAGEAQGGEAGQIQSAGLLVIDAASWPFVDLRVDWHDQPIAELEELWQRYQPQMRDYQVRATDPTIAPSYGVPGDP